MAIPATTYWKGLNAPENLPGPLNLPVLGAAWAMGNPRSFYSVLVKWLDRYGDPYYAALGTRQYIFTANMELARLVLESRPEGARRPQIIQSAFSSIGAEEMLFSAEGKQWKAHRKAISKSLGAHNLTLAERMIKEEVQSQIDKLGQRIQTSKNGVVNFLPSAKRFSVTIISKLVFGEDFRNISTDDSVVRDIESIFQTLARRTSAPFPYWKYLKFSADKKYDQIKQGLDQDVRQQIQNAKNKLQEKPEDYKPETLLEGMLWGSTSDQSNPEAKLTDKEVIDNCIGLIAAGLDTTSTTLSWAVFMLGSRPDIRERLRAELESATSGTGDLKTLQGIHTLPLMEAVIWEALRLYPAAPFLPALTLREFEFEGQVIPKGVTIFFLTSEGERRSAGYDPHFNPDRWFAEGMLAKAIKQLPLPFGAGQRLCPGRNLSVMEIKAMLAGLLHRYDWSVDEHFEPERYYNFTMEPSEVPVRFVRRSYL